MTITGLRIFVWPPPGVGGVPLGPGGGLDTAGVIPLEAVNALPTSADWGPRIVTLEIVEGRAAADRHDPPGQCIFSIRARRGEEAEVEAAQGRLLTVGQLQQAISARPVTYYVTWSGRIVDVEWGTAGPGDEIVATLTALSVQAQLEGYRGHLTSGRSSVTDRHGDFKPAIIEGGRRVPLSGRAVATDGDVVAVASGDQIHPHRFGAPTGQVQPLAGPFRAGLDERPVSVERVGDLMRVEWGLPTPPPPSVSRVALRTFRVSFPRPPITATGLQLEVQYNSVFHGAVVGAWAAAFTQAVAFTAPYGAATFTGAAGFTDIAIRQRWRLPITGGTIFSAWSGFGYAEALVLAAPDPGDLSDFILTDRTDLTLPVSKSFARAEPPTMSGVTAWRLELDPAGRGPAQFIERDISFPGVTLPVLGRLSIDRRPYWLYSPQTRVRYQWGLFGAGGSGWQDWSDWQLVGIPTGVTRALIELGWPEQQRAPETPPSEGPPGTPTRPGTPRTLTAEPSRTSVALSWGEPAQGLAVTQWQLSIDDGVWQDIAAVTTGAALAPVTFTAGGLTAGTGYTFRVRGVGFLDDGRPSTSPPSNTATVTTLGQDRAGAPAAPAAPTIGIVNIGAGGLIPTTDEVTAQITAGTGGGTATFWQYTVFPAGELGDDPNMRANIDAQGFFTVTDLEANTEYVLVVWGVASNANGTTNGVPRHRNFRTAMESSGGAAPARPGAPTLSVLSSGETTATVTWTPPQTGGEVRYYEYRLGTAAWARVTGSTGSTRRFTFSGLTADTTYRVRVRGVARENNQTRTGTQSNQVSFKTLASDPDIPSTPDPTAPNPPSIAAASTFARTTTSITLRWTPPTAGSTPLFYEYQLGAAGDWTRIPGSGSVRAYTVTDLRPATQYVFRMRSAGAGTLRSRPSASRVASTRELTEAPPAPTPPPPGQQPQPPAPPPALRPGAPGTLFARPGETSVVLTWTPPTGGGRISYWQVRRDGLAWTRIPGSDRNTITASFGGLTASTRYTFQVRAVRSGVGPGPPSNLVAVRTRAPEAPPPVGAPGRPGQPTVTGVTRSSAIVSWTAPTTGAAVSFYEWRLGFGVWRRVPGSGTTITLSNLSSATEYQVQVRAVDAMNRRGPRSLARKFTTAAPPMEQPSQQPISTGPVTFGPWRGEWAGIPYFNDRVAKRTVLRPAYPEGFETFVTHWCYELQLEAGRSKAVRVVAVHTVTAVELVGRWPGPLINFFADPGASDGRNQAQWRMGTTARIRIRWGVSGFYNDIGFGFRSGSYFTATAFGRGWYPPGPWTDLNLPSVVTDELDQAVGPNWTAGESISFEL